MLLIDIFENDHPFNFAYPVQNANDVRALSTAFNWAAEQYGASLPMPYRSVRTSIWVVLATIW